MKASVQTGAATGVVEPALGTRAAAELSASEGDWLCAACYNRVANERDRFSFEGKGEFAFSNPDGIRFEIITFSETHGCRETGVPTLEYTWFPGHAWSYCLCVECGQHLGWHYSGKFEFSGLIRRRLVRALYLRN